MNRLLLPLFCLAALAAAPATRPAPVDAGALQARIQSVAGGCVAHTVGLVHTGGDGAIASLSSGSGVVVSAEGLVLTAGHVIDKPGTALTIRFADGRVFHGTAVGLDHLTDTGIARITDPAPAGGWPFSPMAPVDSAHPGDWVLATGNAGSIVVGRDPPLRIGRITVMEPTVMRTNCALEPGDSGGPLFDLAGRVIGINSRIAAATAGSNAPMREYISLHTPVGAFDAEWSQLLAGMNGHPDVNLDTSGRRRRPMAAQITRFRAAMRKLVAAKDPEATKMVADARAGGAERLALSPDQMDRLIRRADALGPTTGPTTLPTAARPTTSPAAVATTRPSGMRRGIPADMRPALREQLRTSLVRQFPTAKVTDDILNHILDRSTYDPDTHQMHIRPELDDLRAMGLSEPAILAAAAGNPALGARSAVSWGKTSLQSLSLFAPALASAGDCMVEVRSGKGTTVLLGTVVDADGWIVTKASDLPDRPTVVLPDGRSVPARLVGSDRPTDLALLKVNAAGLTPARFAADARLGDCICCPTVDPNQPALGVVSVVARPIAVDAPAFVGERKVVLGVEFRGESAVVNRITPGMPADLAGIRAGDEITALNGKSLSGATDLINRMKAVRPGEAVALRLKRDGRNLEVKPTIGQARATTQTVDSLGQTDHYAGGKLSKRRSDFPLALETDAAIWADQCGGPMVNLNGETVAVTIARYDRVCTFALPAPLVSNTVDRLRAAGAKR